MHFASASEQQVTNVLDTHLLASTSIDGLVDELTEAETATRTRPLSTQISAMLKSFPQVRGAWLLDDAGHVLVAANSDATEPAAVPAALGGDALRDPTRDVTFGSLQSGSGTDKFYFTISRPFQHLFSGSIVTAVPSDYFQSFFSQLLGHDTDYAAR